MQTILVALAGVFVGFFAARVLASRARSSKSVTLLLVYDGATLNLYPARVTPEGVSGGSDSELPHGSLYKLSVPGVVLYVSAIERVALADHALMRKARYSVALKALFRSGGDLLFYLQVAALLVPLLLSISIWSSLGNVNATMTAVRADMMVVRDAISKPLEVMP